MIGPYELKPEEVEPAKAYIPLENARHDQTSAANDEQEHENESQKR